MKKATLATLAVLLALGGCSAPAVKTDEQQPVAQTEEQPRMGQTDYSKALQSCVEQGGGRMIDWEGRKKYEAVFHRTFPTIKDRERFFLDDTKSCDLGNGLKLIAYHFLKMDAVCHFLLTIQDANDTVLHSVDTLYPNSQECAAFNPVAVEGNKVLLYRKMYSGAPIGGGFLMYQYDIVDFSSFTSQRVWFRKIDAQTDHELKVIESWQNDSIDIPALFREQFKKAEADMQMTMQKMPSH